MKNLTKTNFALFSSLALAATLVIASAVWTPVQAETHETAVGKRDAKMMEHCQAMKAQHQKMSADMKAQDAELTAHVAKMNAAPADKKLDILAAIVTHMVEQRIAMDAQMATMHEGMMDHMMQGMSMDSTNKPHGAVDKDATKAEVNADNEHKAPHPEQN